MSSKKKIIATVIVATVVIAIAVITSVIITTVTYDEDVHHQLEFAQIETQIQEDYYSR